MKDLLLTLADKLEHLPSRKQRELASVVEIIFKAFEDAQKTKLSEKARAGRILKLILFGSHARGDWVEDRSTGYMSDYDILAVVNYEAFAEEKNDVWMDIDERFSRDLLVTKRLKAPVSIIAHTLGDVNDKLAQGLPFFVDIIRDGIMLYEAPGHPFAEPKPLTTEQIVQTAKSYFESWFTDAVYFGKLGQTAMDDQRLNIAAFELHQSVERLYHCLLLVLTLYTPKLHNIAKLRDIAEGVDPHLIEAWPRNTKFSRRCYERLRRAYVEARYSQHYEITREELDWIIQRIKVLQGIVEDICRKKLAPI